MRVNGSVIPIVEYTPRLYDGYSLVCLSGGIDLILILDILCRYMLCALKLFSCVCYAEWP